MTLTNVQLDDDLAEAFAPALVFGTPEVETSDFSLNTDYDGISLIDLFTGNDSLAVGTAGSLNLTARVDITTGGPAQGNTAYGQSDQLQTRIPSNDPNVTPGTPGDVNPAPLLLADTDGDGVPDSFESASADRDGDGITVTGPNGTNNAIGTANDIVIIQDGSNGSSNSM